jgi:hypothetical protein
MKYLIAAIVLLFLTKCAPTNPLVIAGYEDLTAKDQVPYVDIPCYRDNLVHGADTFQQRRLTEAYRLHNNAGYLLRFKDSKGDEKLTYLVETDTACVVTRVTTAFPMEKK